jgi:hypothetical protein
MKRIQDVCHYLSDVGSAGSNALTSEFATDYSLRGEPSFQLVGAI